jgi:hypothetical protein
MTIDIASLTSATLDGTGVFDVLMRANKAHLESEFAKNRIKGPEYSTVYLGSLAQVMQAALQFVLSQEKANLEATLLQQQILLAQAEVQKATATLAQIQAQTALINQQLANAVVEETVLVAQECKLRGEFDLIVSNTLKSTQETALLSQKTATERAQVLALGVDENSVVGKQKLLYQAQTDGFKRDAEQKAAKLMIDTWNVRRTTDEATVADSVNSLNDVAVGRAVNKLLNGVQA